MANKVPISISKFTGVPFPLLQTLWIDDDELDAVSLSEHDDDDDDDRRDPGVSSPRSGR